MQKQIYNKRKNYKVLGLTSNNSFTSDVDN